jgi:hypothetical protein
VASGLPDFPTQAFRVLALGAEAVLTARGMKVVLLPSAAAWIQKR